MFVFSLTIGHLVGECYWTMLPIQERIKRRRSFIFANANHYECDIYQNQTDEYYWSRPPDWFEPGNFQQAQKLFRTFKST